MVQIIKQHKVTGEIIRVDAKDAWISSLDGTIPAHIFAKIQAATEAATEYRIIAQEGKKEAERYVMTAKDKELKEYCDDHDAVVRAMNM